MVGAKGANVIVQISSAILLARILGPRDVGLVTIVIALVIFAPFLTDLGMTDSVTQKKQISHEEISTLFWLNFTFGAAMTVLFAAASPLISWTFGEPALAGIALVSSLTFLMTALPIQHYALMRRAMEFRRIAVIDLSAAVASSIVAVGMAMAGSGYWALVTKPILQLAITAVGAWVCCPWLPGRARVTPELKGHLKFGFSITAFALGDQLTRSVDRLAIGLFHGPGALGYFQNAFLLYSNMISLLLEPLHNVAVTTLSKLRENLDELRRVWFTALSSVTFFTIPLFACLAVAGQDVVVILLGEKWSPAGPLLSLFGLRGIAQCTERTMGWLHVVSGRPDRWMRWGFFSTPCQLVALAIGLPFGPAGVVTSYTVTMFCLFIPALAYSGAPLGIGARQVVAATLPQVAAGLIAAVASYGLQKAFLVESAQLTRVGLSIPFCIAVYVTVVVGVFRVSGPLMLAAVLIRELVGRVLRSMT